MLGRGGQGDVVRALDRQHDRWVALKIRPAPDADRRRELLSEARILLGLPHHPNLPLVREDFFWDDRYVLVMDWVDGIDLAQLVADTGDPGLPINGVVDWMAQVASALDHLHGQGIVHGDVKPANIVLTPEGRAVLVDFGISRMALDASDELQAGSPGFAAPEQAQHGPLTPATDVYGLAATTVALLTGAPPSGGRPDWDGVPDALAVERALRRGLSIEPDRRPRRAAELVERMQAQIALALPTGVVSFLLSDIEGSSLLWEHDPEAMADVLASHDNLIAEAVEAHGGRLLKTRGEGDATFSVFASATAAVAAAVDAQLHLVQRIGLGVRMAVHSGEAQVRDGDYYGRTVNRVARLRELGPGGQVLVSSATADLVADSLPERAYLVDLGEHELRGLNRVERVWGIGHPALSPPLVAGAETAAARAPERARREGSRRRASGRVESERLAPTVPPVPPGAPAARDRPTPGRGGTPSGRDHEHTARDDRDGDAAARDDAQSRAGGASSSAGGSDVADVADAPSAAGVGASLLGAGTAIEHIWLDRLRDQLAPVLLGEGRMVLLGGRRADTGAVVADLAEVARLAGAELSTIDASADDATGDGLPHALDDVVDPATVAAARAADGEPSSAPFDVVIASALMGAPSTPRVLAIVDAHRAGGSMLVVLEALADRLPGSGALVVVTYDDESGSRSDHPLAATLAALARKPAVSKLVLERHDVDDETVVAGPASASRRPLRVASTAGRPASRPMAAEAQLPQPSPPASWAGAGLWHRPDHFVGRAAELVEMRRVMPAVDGNEHRFVVVSGEPGIGKTSLAAELATEAQADGALVLFGRCDDDAPVPFQPFAEIVRDVARSGVAPAARWPSELLRLVPELSPAAVESFTPSDPEIGRYRFFEAMGSLLDDLADGRSIVLVVDDLQWADRPTLSLLRHLLRRRSSHPLLVVGTYRDTEVDRVHPLTDLLADLRREQIVHRVPLDGLTVDDTRKLLEARSGRPLDLGERDFAEHLQRAAEGNPFFIDELVRHLTETGGLDTASRRWELRQTSWADLAVPEGICDVIAQRLGRVTEPARQILATVAILGREAPLRLVRAMADLDDDDLLEGVEEVVATGLMVERAGDEAPVLAFGHALVREVVYAGMSLLRRQRAHLRAATTIESVYASDPVVLADHAAALAAHHRLSGAGGDAQQVLAWSERAGESAARVFAYEEAIAHWETAIGILRAQDGPAAELRLARLLERLGSLMWLSGVDEDGGVEEQQEALRIFERHGVVDRAARVHVRLAAHFSTLGIRRVLDVGRSLDHIARAEPMLAGNDRDDGGYYHVAQATALLGDLQLPAAEASAQHAVEIADWLGDRVLGANASLVLALAEWESGRLAEAAVRMEEAWRVARDALDPVLSLVCAWNRGNQLMQVDEHAEAVRWYERELRNDSLARAAGARALLERNLTVALYQLGRDDQLRVLLGRTGPRTDLFVDNDWADALAVQLAQHDERVAMGDRWGVVWHAPMLAAHARLADRYDEAARVVDVALPLAEARGALVSEALLRIQHGRILTEDGHLDEAQSTLDRARLVVGAVAGWGASIGRLLVADGVLASRRGDLAAAREALAGAVSCFDVASLPYLEADALVLAGRAEREAGSPSSADRHLSTALAVYADLGSPPSFAERARRVAG